MDITCREDKLLCLVLCRMTFLSTGEKIKLIKKLDSLHNVIVQSIEDISTIIGRKSRARWNGKFVLRQAQQDLHLIEKLNISTVLCTDEVYPASLREISDPPFLLFYRGNIKILRNSCISVVGTRRMSMNAGRECVEFSKSACLDGNNIVSGLAYGIDRKAHEGALKAFEEASDKSLVGRTVAVLPGAIDNIVPEGNRKLAVKILESGGVILSEYPPGEEALPYRFVQRNRIIAGLSSATVVIQAPPGSGAMHTAEFALDYNRELMFHREAFSDSSMKISSIVRRQLSIAADKNSIEEKKLKMDPELYVHDGAPIIKNYADFLECMFELPGKRSCEQTKEVQLTLFD